MRRNPDMRYPLNEPTTGSKLAGVLFWLVVIPVSGLMLGVLLASVS